MAFDGIMTKVVAKELSLLSGARIDKVYEPNSNNIILGLYLNKCNYALNICTNPQNYRINLTTHPKSNRGVAPNFCMVLRKHLIGLRIKNVITNSLERIITIEFEGFDDIDDIINKKLIIELMGKHCNVILLDDENIIIDCLRHINNENATHITIPHIKYVYPKTDKLDFLSCDNFDYFKKIVSETDSSLYAKSISNKFNGISKQFISSYNASNLEDIYNYIRDIIFRIDSLKLRLELTDKDYFLVPDDNNSENFSVNFALDDFYYKKEHDEELKTKYGNGEIDLYITKENKFLLSFILKKDVNRLRIDLTDISGVSFEIIGIEGISKEELIWEDFIFYNNKYISNSADPKIIINKNVKANNKIIMTMNIKELEKKDFLNIINYAIKEEEEKKQLQQELEKILNSTSWKVTKPLRYLSSKLRK